MAEVVAPNTKRRRIRSRAGLVIVSGGGGGSLDSFREERNSKSRMMGSVDRQQHQASSARSGTSWTEGSDHVTRALHLGAPSTGRDEDATNGPAAAAHVSPRISQRPLHRGRVRHHTPRAAPGGGSGAGVTNAVTGAVGGGKEPPPPAPDILRVNCLFIPIIVGAWWYWTKRKARRVVKLLHHHENLRRGGHNGGGKNKDGDEGDEESGYYYNEEDEDDYSSEESDPFSSWNEVVTNDNMDESQKFVLWIKKAKCGSLEMTTQRTSFSVMRTRSKTSGAAAGNGGGASYTPPPQALSPTDGDVPESGGCGPGPQWEHIDDLNATDLSGGTAADRDLFASPICSPMGKENVIYDAAYDTCSIMSGTVSVVTALSGAGGGGAGAQQHVGDVVMRLCPVASHDSSVHDPIKGQQQAAMMNDAAAGGGQQPSSPPPPDGYPSLM